MNNLIRKALKDKGLTQKQLAKEIGMTEVGLSKAINGSATIATIKRVADCLGINPDELIITAPILKAKYGSDKTPLKFGDLEIACYVLEDGRRVLSGRGLQKALGYESKSGQWMKAFANLDGLRDAMYAGELSVFDRLSNPIKFIRKDAGGSQSTTNGYEATLLIDICSAIIDANRAGVFNNERIVFNADVIIRSVAKVGIIALIDEATGYEEVKNKQKDSLQKWLNTFLAEEASRWVKTFPDSFFEMIYKMYGWTWTNSPQKPGVVGNIINDWVYLRLGPKVLDELNRLNPKNVKGNRSHKHHQNLSELVGKPALQRHLEALKALGAATCYDKARFLEALNRAYPRPDEQFTFDFGEWE